MFQEVDPLLQTFVSLGPLGEKGQSFWLWVLIWAWPAGVAKEPSMLLTDTEWFDVPGRVCHMSSSKVPLTESSELIWLNLILEKYVVFLYCVLHFFVTEAAFSAEYVF